MVVVLDLCSGTGSATESFLVHPNFKVIRVDFDPRFSTVPYTRIKNVLEWMDWIDELGHIDLVWASPPCTEFSLAANAHRPRPENPDMSIVEACLDIIEHLQPRMWILENVRGAIRYFKDKLGDPLQVCGPFYLWGQFPTLDVPYDLDHSKLDNRDPMLRAMIPWQISDAVVGAWFQPNLEEWI